MPVKFISHKFGLDWRGGGVLSTEARSLHGGQGLLHLQSWVDGHPGEHSKLEPRCGWTLGTWWVMAIWINFCIPFSLYHILLTYQYHPESHEARIIFRMTIFYSSKNQKVFRDALRKKNGIMWGKFPSGEKLPPPTRPQPPDLRTPCSAKKIMDYFSFKNL